MRCSKCGYHRPVSPNHAVGEKMYNAKLTEFDVRAIRKLRRSKTILQLATKFGVGRSQIWRIIHRRKWKHVE